MRRSRAAALVAAVTASALVLPDPAAAHGLVGRADLPIPTGCSGGPPRSF